MGMLQPRIHEKCMLRHRAPILPWGVAELGSRPLRPGRRRLQVCHSWPPNLDCEAMPVVATTTQADGHRPLLVGKKMQSCSGASHRQVISSSKFAKTHTIVLLSASHTSAAPTHKSGHALNYIVGSRVKQVSLCLSVSIYSSSTLAR